MVEGLAQCPGPEAFQLAFRLGGRQPVGLRQYLIRRVETECPARSGVATICFPHHSENFDRSRMSFVERVRSDWVILL